MSIGLCEPIEDDDGYDVTESNALKVLNVNLLSVWLGNGGWIAGTTVRAQILDADDNLIDTVVVASNDSTWYLYANCELLEGVPPEDLNIPIGGPDFHTGARWTVPEGGKLKITAIGATHKLIGWATLLFKGVDIYNVDSDGDLVSKIRPGGPVWSDRRYLFQYKIFGSGIYGRKPGKFHGHCQTYEDGGNQIYWDFTGVQENYWGAEVMETELNEAQKSRMAFMSQQYPDFIVYD